MERMAALYTDGIRAEILENHGYRTQILEFIDMEHTPKNVLIRAVKEGKGKKNGKKLAGNDGFPACGEYAGKRDRYSDVNGPGHRKWTSDPADLPNDNRMGVFIGQCLSGFWPGKRPGTDESNTDPFENLKMCVPITF